MLLIFAHSCDHPHIQMWGGGSGLKMDLKLKTAPTMKPVARLQHGYSQTEGRLHDDSVNLYTQSMVSPRGFEKVAFKDFVFLHKFSTIAEVQVTAVASKNTN